jgi:MFS family permease
VLFLTETLKAPIALFGFLVATPAIGAVIGSLAVPKISERFGRTKTMAVSIVSSSVLVAFQGLSPNYWVLAVLVTAGSMVITGWNVLLMSTYHQIIPRELFGRIHGTRRTLVWGLMPIGSLLGGLLASIDLRLPFYVGGIVCSIIAVLGFRFIVNLENAWVKTEEAK